MKSYSIYNELEALERFLADYMGDNAEGTVLLKFEGQEDWVHQETIGIKQSVRHRVYSFKRNEKQIRNYVEFIQSGLIRLSDQLYNENATVSTAQNPIQRLLFPILNDAILDLLSHLKADYTTYFNFSLKVPELFKRHQLDDVYKRQVECVIEAMENAQVDSSLLNIIKEYLYSSGEFQELGVENFAQLDYLLMFQSALYSRSQEKHPEQDFESLIKRDLVYLNFNALPFIWFCIKRVQKNYDQVDHYEEALREAAHILRILQQLPVKASCAYDLSADSFKKTMEKVILEEIEYIRSLQQIHIKSTKQIGNNVASKLYFQVSLTLDQLTLLFRVMMEYGVIQAKRKVDVYTFISRHIGTAKKDNLSLGSIKNKFSDPQFNAAKKLKEVLSGMVNLLNEKYLLLFVFPIL